MKSNLVIDGSNNNLPNTYHSPNNRSNSHRQPRIFTWRIRAYPLQGDTNEAFVDNEFQKSFQLWSRISNIEFQKINNAVTPTDIDIFFDVYDRDELCNRTYLSGERAHITKSGVPSQIHFSGKIFWTVSTGTVHFVNCF